ncbi:MAG: undecaprenyl-phosphate glucose phosphotransferase [Proteobacteria bacterium]|jgi:putative colanic acid biosynthesis UDP-glucose lipid carrier transferase|nr:undecaprenyl-phosphate glucose phosphotransferase [Pseudomonadota bacterium]
MTRSLIKPYSTLFDAAVRVFDPVLIAATGVVAYRLYLGGWNPPVSYVLAIALAAALAASLMPMLGLYQSQRGVTFATELAAIFTAWLAIAVTGSVYFFFTKTGTHFSRGWALIWVVGGFTLHAATRAALRLELRRQRRLGRNLRHIVVVGARDHGRSVAARLRSAAWSGFAVRAYYDDDPALIGTTQDGIPVRGPIAALARDLRSEPVDQVWIALPLAAEKRIRECVDSLRQTPVVVRFVPNLQGFHLLNHSIGDIAGMPVLSLTDSPLDGIRASWKAIEDYALAALLLVALSPLLVVIAIGIKLSSPGPIVFRQERVTWNGRHFPMFKFRTMTVDTEAHSGPVWTTLDDQRATRFGAVLRRFSLDELPQLVNVLRGEMSLVGPRPERPEFVTAFRTQVPDYMQKHLVKAGITGWAQVNDLRGDSDLMLRIQYDLYYIGHWSPWFDLRILALTFWHILTSRHAH